MHSESDFQSEYTQDIESGSFISGASIGLSFIGISEVKINNSLLLVNNNL